MRDHYAVLQVSPRAEPEVIRAAYRVLARKYHPDHGGDRERMIALNDAWDVLGDPARRAAYDAARAAAARNPFGGARSSTWTSVARQPGQAPGRRSPSGDGSAGGPAPAGSAAWFESGIPDAGPPPGNPSGSILDFGRYRGWSLGEIARQDPDYIEWLLRATVGRRLRAELEELLRQRRAATRAAGPAARR